MITEEFQCRLSLCLEGDSAIIREQALPSTLILLQFVPFVGVQVNLLFALYVVHVVHVVIGVAIAALWITY